MTDYHKLQEQKNQARYWKHHTKNLKEKTIMKNKPHLGDILPEHKTGEQMKLETNYNLANLIKSIAPAQILNKG